MHKHGLVVVTLVSQLLRGQFFSGESKTKGGRGAHIVKRLRSRHLFDFQCYWTVNISYINK